MAFGLALHHQHGQKGEYPEDQADQHPRQKTAVARRRCDAGDHGETKLQGDKEFHWRPQSLNERRGYTNLLVLSFEAEFRTLERALTSLERRQLPFAVSQALNDTAKDVQRAMQNEINNKVDRPTPFTRRAVFV